MVSWEGMQLDVEMAYLLDRICMGDSTPICLSTSSFSPTQAMDWHPKVYYLVQRKPSCQTPSTLPIGRIIV